LSHPRTLPAPALAAVNHLLEQASWARQKLQPFAGQCAHLNLPPFSALFSITADGLIAAPPAEATAAVTLDLPASAPLLALQGKAAVMRAARITGSAEFAQELGYVMQHLHWDIAPTPEASKPWARLRSLLRSYSTVTDLARLRGLSTSVPLTSAT